LLLARRHVLLKAFCAKSGCRRPKEGAARPSTPTPPVTYADTGFAFHAARHGQLPALQQCKRKRRFAPGSAAADNNDIAVVCNAEHYS